MTPDHPLAAEPEPLSDETVLRHRAVAAADSSRLLPPRTVALLGGQDVLTVPTIVDKRLAHIAGLGVGHMPHYLVANDLAAGRLVSREMANISLSPNLQLAWRSAHKGRALRWFVERLSDAALCRELIAP